MTGTVIASEVASVIAPLCGPVLSAPVQSETGGPRPLAARAASGSAWLIAARMGTRAIDLATLMLLARLLTPADFGVVAVAMVLVQIVEAVFELPVAQVLVRAASPAHRTSGATGDDRAMLDTAFTLSVARGLVVAALLAAAALPFARAYHDGRLLGLICFLALAPALRGIASPRLALYARVLDFRRDCASDLVGKLCSFGVAVILARLTHSYWAIAAGTVTSPAIATVASFVLAPHRPRLTLVHWREFAGFLGWSSASQVLSAVNWQAGRLLLSGFVPRAALGLFSLGSDLSGIPEQAIVKPVQRPLMSAFALVAFEPERLERAYLRSVASLVTAGTPLMLGIGLLAAPAIRLALGERWLGAAPLVTWLALGNIAPLFAAPFAPLAMALGRTDRLFRRNLIESAIRLPLIVAGAWAWGARGVAGAVALAAVAVSLNIMALVGRMIGVSLVRQLGAAWRSMVAGVLSAGVSVALCPITNGQTGLGLLLTLALCAAGGGVAYLAGLLAAWHLAGRPDGIEAALMRVAAQLTERVAARLTRA